MEGRVGYGLHTEELEIAESGRLEDHCSVFQAEDIAINRAAVLLLEHRISQEDIRIFSDSQAAIRALNSGITKSETVEACLLSLNEIASRNRLRVIWIPGHSDFTGNCEADRLAREDTLQNLDPSRPASYIPISNSKLLVD